MVGQLTIYPHSGTVKCEMVAGADETGAGVNIPVTGMLTTDGLYGVCMVTGANIMAQWRPLSDFSVSALAGNLTVVAHPVDTTGQTYLIIWQDLT